jgi:hypothetical protein
MAQCPRCLSQVEEDELRPLMGEKVCEDCYIKLVDLTKECDPWAAYTAKRTMAQMGGKLTADQQQLYDLVKAKQELPLKLAAKQLNWDEARVHQEVITLRHLDMVKTKVVGPDIILSL